MSRSILCLILFNLVKMCFATSGSAAYWDLQYEYGAINAGTAGTFSTTSYSDFIVDHNPAMVSFSDRVQISYSSQPFNVFSKYIHNYSSLSIKHNKYGFGFSNRQFYSDNNDVDIRNSAISFSIGKQLSKTSSMGITIKSINSKQNDFNSTNYAFGLGLVWINLFPKMTFQIDRESENLSFIPNYFIKYFPYLIYQKGITIGLSLRNLGPDVRYIYTSDPLPQSFHLGLSYVPLKSDLITIRMGYELERDLVSSFPDMDWDNDGVIGGYDDEGHKSVNDAIYNSQGQQETAHTDTWYRAIFTSWISHWLLGGDRDKPDNNQNLDGQIGGYTIDEDGNIIETDVEWGEPSYGKYNSAGLLELGTGDARTFIDEWEQTIHHFGVEVSIFGIFGYKIGNLRHIAGGSDTNSWGYFIGPDFFRYHYSEMNEMGERYIENTQRFHTIELNYTENLRRLLKNVFNK